MVKVYKKESRQTKLPKTMIWSTEMVKDASGSIFDKRGKRTFSSSRGTARKLVTRSLFEPSSPSISTAKILRSKGERWSGCWVASAETGLSHLFPEIVPQRSRRPTRATPS